MEFVFVVLLIRRSRSVRLTSCIMVQHSASIPEQHRLVSHHVEDLLHVPQRVPHEGKVIPKASRTPSQPVYICHFHASLFSVGLTTRSKSKWLALTEHDRLSVKYSVRLSDTRRGLRKRTMTSCHAGNYKMRPEPDKKEGKVSTLLL